MLLHKLSVCRPQVAGILDDIAGALGVAALCVQLGAPFVDVRERHEILLQAADGQARALLVGKRRRAVATHPHVRSGAIPRIHIEAPPPPPVAVKSGFRLERTISEK
jgi:hypothetical protein